MQRVGLFGGSFDPPHAGHLQLAHTALDFLALDELLWIPAGQPWQRQHRLAAGEHRASILSGRASTMLDCGMRIAE